MSREKTKITSFARLLLGAQTKATLIGTQRPSDGRRLRSIAGGAMHIISTEDVVKSVVLITVPSLGAET